MEQKITIPEGYELQKVNDSEYRIVKIKKELPNSWEEFCETHTMQEEEAWINDFAVIRIVVSKGGDITNKWFNFLPNKEYAEAILSLIQLIQLRDCYRDGWKPNWEEFTPKESIIFFNDDFLFDNHAREAKIFSFQSKKIRDKFYNNFKDLIEKTKPLFM